MLVKPRAGQAARIKVVGTGGGGGNAISSMITEGGIEGVEFVAINTDAQALLSNKASIKIQVGDNLTRGLGSGGDPEMGRQAAEESREKIKEELDGCDMVFITCGMGGGTGTGASPIIAEVAKETGALTVAVVTKPFNFEMTRRRNAAEDGIAKLKEKVDTLIVVPNQKILEVVEKNTPMVEAFKRIDSVLHQGVKGIAELITLPGLINVDFADVKAIMSNAGTALMGMGTGSGEKRAVTAMQQAISSPLIDISIEGAKGILFNVAGGNDLTMTEIDEAAAMITKAVHPDADIIFGAVVDENMVDQVKISVIATRFDEGARARSMFTKAVPAHHVPAHQSTGMGSDEEPPIHPPEDFERATSSNQPVSHTSSRMNTSSLLEDSDYDDEDFDVPAFKRRGR